jgi:mycofactocin system creatininase family protein
MLSTAHWPDVEAGPRRLLVVPVGSLEQHGAHLPLDTDTRIATAVAVRACAGRPGVALAPPIAIGASGEHADFPGTLSIGTVALSTLLVELGRHASLDWPAMLLVNGHGGNAAAIRDAVKLLAYEGRRCRGWHAGLRPAMLAAGESLVPDAHAGRVETSIMLALAPDDVRFDQASAPAASATSARTASSATRPAPPRRRESGCSACSSTTSARPWTGCSASGAPTSGGSGAAPGERDARPGLVMGGVAGGAWLVTSRWG